MRPGVLEARPKFQYVKLSGSQWNKWHVPERVYIPYDPGLPSFAVVKCGRRFYMQEAQLAFDYEEALGDTRFYSDALCRNCVYEIRKEIAYKAALKRYREEKAAWQQLRLELA